MISHMAAHEITFWAPDLGVVLASVALLGVDDDIIVVDSWELVRVIMGSYTSLLVNFGKRKVKMFLLPLVVDIGYPAGIVVLLPSTII